jgi:hypothetical protein
MNTTEEARLFSVLASNATNPAHGVQTAQKLLQDAVRQRVPAWGTALSYIARIDPFLAQQAVSQAIDLYNLSEYVNIFVGNDKTTREVVEQALVKLASEKDSQLGQAIKKTIQEHYGLSDQQVDTIIQDGKTVKDYLCPFVMRPAETFTGIHLDEFVNEPDDRPTAAHVTVWVYYKDGKISHLVVAGHANHSVCKEISAKIAATNVRLGEQPLKSFTLTGASLLINTAKQKQKPSKSGITEPPLEDLVKQLRDVEAMTGMLKIHEIQDVEYELICKSLEKIIKESRANTTPVILRHEPQMDRDQAVFLPFYDLTASKLTPVTLELDINEFGPDFSALLEMHGAEYIYEMIADAKRRRAIYAGWLADDQQRISILVREMFRRMTEFLQLSNPDELSSQYLGVLNSSDADINIPWSPDQPITHRHILLSNRTQRLLQFIQNSASPINQGQVNWSSGFPALAGLQSIPSMPKGNFNAAIQAIQNPEFPVSGVRNFADATIQEGTIAFHISLQEQVEWNLPSLIASDHRWLDHMDEILEQLDTSDPKHRAQMESGNLQLFCDSFLRGWPSVFLPYKSQKARYEEWCQQYRHKVWESLREKLFVRGMRMEPLVSDNVVFNVRRIDSQKVEITPYYLANKRTFLVILHRNYGITYYINPWQHRRSNVTTFPSVQEKRTTYLQEFDKAAGQLAQGNYPEALDGFKQTLRLYPIAAGEALIQRYWQQNFRDTTHEFLAFSELAAALFNFDRNRAKSCQVFTKFIKEYPDFLPDPYLYLGFNEHKQSEQVFEQRQQLVKLQEDYNLELNRLVETGTLIRENEGLSGRTQYKIIGGAYLNEYKIGELNLRQSKIEEAAKALKAKEQQLWNEIRQSPNEEIKHAMTLDQVYMATIFKLGKLDVSNNFRRLVGSLYGVLRAQAFMDIRSSLEKGLQEKGESLIERLKKRDAASQAKILKELADLVSDHSGGVYLTPEDLTPINNLREFLENLQTVDSITRENLIRRQFEEAIGACVRNAYKAYDAAVNFNIGLTEVRHQYTDCIGYTWSYLNAVKSLIGSDKFVLHNGIADSHFNVQDVKQIGFERLSLNTLFETIDVVNAQGQAKSVLKYDAIDSETARHLITEFENPDFIAQVRASGLRMPYALLYTPVKAHPAMQRWQKLLGDLTPWLIQALAHLGLLPLDKKVINREEALEISDHTDAIEQIVVDIDRVCEDFISKIDRPEVDIVTKNIL